MNRVYIFSNESISKKNETYNCDNLDIKSIAEGLQESFDINLIARESKIDRKHTINKININLAKNIILFIKLTIASLKKKDNSKYFIVSITPYTFIACIILFLFKVKPTVYLRSDGYEEYNAIFGKAGKLIYHVMFELTSTLSKFISCRKHILKNKEGEIVSPSHLNEKWFQNIKTPSLNSIDLLYVGRIRVEKGIFSFLKIFKYLNRNMNLSIVCSKIDSNKIKPIKNVFFIDTLPEVSLIDVYDKCNIFILPSFTEGHPQVLDEALSRLRPVIVFEEIEHVKRDRKGVFSCKRDRKEFEQKIDFILKNYSKIQDEMKKNKLPKKNSFLNELKTILANDN